MPQQIQKGKRNKKLVRAGRDKVHNTYTRPAKIAHARRTHLKHALKSNGVEFRDALKVYYQANPVSATKTWKHGKHAKKLEDK